MYFKDKKTKLSLQNMFGYGAARGGGKPTFFQKKKARNVVSALSIRDPTLKKSAFALFFLYEEQSVTRLYTALHRRSLPYGDRPPKAEVLL